MRLWMIFQIWRARHDTKSNNQGSDGDMLTDEDRIFTNLYGMHERTLKGAIEAWPLGWHQGQDPAARAATGSSNTMKASRSCADAAGRGSPRVSNGPSCPRKATVGPAYLVVNADESEPGTCKDREIMRHDPHTLIEGCLIASFAMNAHACYIYIRGEYIREREALQNADRRGLRGRSDRQATPASPAGISTSTSRTGPGAYICGEETALLESLEGKKGMPRMKPPFPGGCGALWLPHHGEQRGKHRGGAHHPAARRGLVCQALGNPNNCGHQDFRRSRAMSTTLASSKTPCPSASRS